MTPGVSNVNQVQRVTLGSEAIRLGYQLSLTHEGHTYTTATIAGNATEAQIQAALGKAFVITGARFSVVKTAPDTFTVTAGGTLSGQSIQPMALQVEGQAAPAQKGSGAFVPNNVAQNIGNLKTAYAQVRQASPALSRGRTNPCHQARPAFPSA